MIERLGHGHFDVFNYVFPEVLLLRMHEERLRALGVQQFDSVVQTVDVHRRHLTMQVVHDQISHFKVAIQNIVEFKVLVVGTEWKHQILPHFQPADVEQKLKNRKYWYISAREGRKL